MRSLLQTGTPPCVSKYETLKTDLYTYQETNDTRVSDLEERVDKIDEELKQLKK